MSIVVNKTRLPVTQWQTESGSVVSISDARKRYAKSLSVALEPIQSGSGDPSPDNIRPISGTSSVTAVRTGKNLIENTGSSRENKSVTYTANQDGSVTLTGTASGGTSWWRGITTIAERRYIKAGTYRLSGGISNDIILYLIGQYIDGTALMNATVGGGVYDKGSGLTFTLYSDAYLTYQIQVNNGTSTGVTVYPIISDFATVYEPYQGISVTLSLGQTVYGGTVNLVSGVMILNRAMVVYDGSNDETWNISPAWGKTNTAVFYSTAISGAYYPDWTDYRGILTNLFLNATRNYTYNNDVECCGFSGTAVTSPSPTIRILKTRANDVASFRSFLNSNNLQFCYELVTPQTILLSPNQIEMLMRNNTVWSDAGVVTLEYARIHQ